MTTNKEQGNEKQKMVERASNDSECSLEVEWTESDSERGPKCLYMPQLLLNLTPKRQRIEEHSKVAHDSLSQAVWSVNRLKYTGFRTIFEEKQMSTNGVVDNYPEF